MKKQYVHKLAVMADQLRITTLKMIHKGGSGHCGGSLSAMDILTALYFHVLSIRPEEPLWKDRDRFVLSKGHACPALYAVLAKKGFFPASQLDSFRQINSMLRGHPEYGLPGIETVTGSLGQGFAVAQGMAIGLQKKKLPQRVYCLLGDGEIQEGIVWETAMTSGHYKLDNFTCLIDHNRLQGDGAICDIMDIDPLLDKWRAFKWEVTEIDGHNINEIVDALAWAQTIKGAPQMIVAHTTKGKGVSFMENIPAWHGTAPPTNQELDIALRELTNCNQKKD